MATQKYTIIDTNGESKGMVLIEQNPIFEHSTPTIPQEGAVSDAILFLTVLGGFTTAAFLLPGPSWVAPTVGITITATLAGVKAWRSASVEEVNQGEEVTIKLESWTNEGQVLLDEIQDTSIEFEDWQRLAKAVITDGLNFSRPALKGVITQTVYHKIKEEFMRLNFAHRKGNSYVLSPRAMAFLRKVQTLPY